MRERVSRTDRVKEKERSSRRCDALPRAEVIDRGCNENGGVTRWVRGCGGRRGERDRERGGRRNGGEKEEGRTESKEERRRGSECKRRPLEGFACSCIDRRRLSCASAPPCIPPPSLPPPIPPPTNPCSSGSASLSLLYPFLPLYPPPIHHPVISPRVHPFLSQAESRAPRSPDLAQPPNQRCRRHGGCCARRACERDPQN